MELLVVSFFLYNFTTPFHYYLLRFQKTDISLKSIYAEK